MNLNVIMSQNYDIITSPTLKKKDKIFKVEKILNENVDDINMVVKEKKSEKVKKN